MCAESAVGPGVEVHVDFGVPDVPDVPADVSGATGESDVTVAVQPVQRLPLAAAVELSIAGVED